MLNRCWNRYFKPAFLYVVSPLTFRKSGFSTGGRIDSFISDADVAESHEILIRAPADLVFDVARNLDLLSIPLVNVIFRLREKFFRLRSKPRSHRQGLVAETMALGWGVLVERPHRELVMGAVTQPWVGEVKFRSIAPECFANFAEPDLVKIAWTLEVEPVDQGLTRFRTQTRVLATDQNARRKFRRYWRLVGTGIILIRRLGNRAIRRESERRSRSGPTFTNDRPVLHKGRLMKSIGIFYATREGQTRRIAEHVAATLGSRGFGVEVSNVQVGGRTVNLREYAAVILAASVHAGEHEREMVKFVKEYRVQLECLPAAFLSVTLSQAGAERPTATPEERGRFSADVEKMLSHFYEETGWHPHCVKRVAGALLYTKYGMLMRFVMKWIAKKAGAETDTSRDYEYTNWAALDSFTNEFADEISLVARSV
jgi:menaquinone-dependent protoporphyrinogen oxidase